MLMSSYDDSEEAEAAIREHITWLAERKLTMQEAKKHMINVAKSRGFFQGYIDGELNDKMLSQELAESELYLVMSGAEWLPVGQAATTFTRRRRKRASSTSCRYPYVVVLAMVMPPSVWRFERFRAIYSDWVLQMNAGQRGEDRSVLIIVP